MDNKSRGKTSDRLNLAELLNRKNALPISSSSESINQQDAILELRRGESQTLFEQGLYELKSSRFADALGSLAAASALDPNNAKAKINLAVVFAELGLRQKAIDILEEILHLNPDDELVKQNLDVLKEI
ncbi:MAG: tetratricopeptide repeat protein [Desulfamplus sp.]|nr:tetratricopeptide repeat protein [Desulfamplus sp.]